MIWFDVWPDLSISRSFSLSLVLNTDPHSSCTARTLHLGPPGWARTSAALSLHLLIPDPAIGYILKTKRTNKKLIFLSTLLVSLLINDYFNSFCYQWEEAPLFVYRYSGCIWRHIMIHCIFIYQFFTCLATDFTVILKVFFDHQTNYTVYPVIQQQDSTPPFKL